MISISSDSSEGPESRVAGPSSHPGKKVKVKVENDDEWEKLVVQTVTVGIMGVNPAEVKLAKIKSILEEAGGDDRWNELKEPIRAVIEMTPVEVKLAKLSSIIMGLEHEIKEDKRGQS